jgi:hypothetical protein
MVEERRRMRDEKSPTYEILYQNMYEKEKHLKQLEEE